MRTRRRRPGRRAAAPAAAPDATPTAAACACRRARRCRRFARGVLALPRLAAGASAWRCCALPPAGRCAAFAARRASPWPSCAAACRRACARELIDPLCVAALNTPADEASAHGLPARAARRPVQRPRRGRPAAAARPLSDAAARRRPAHWLRAAGRRRAPGHARAGSCEPRRRRLAGRRRALRRGRAGLHRRRSGAPGAPHRAGLVAQAARAAATSPSSPSTCAAPGARLPAPMLALQDGPEAPAQFVFDHGAAAAARAAVVRLRGQRCGAPGSSAGSTPRRRPCSPRPRRRFAGTLAGAARRVLRHTAAEKRATFRCTPGLRAPADARSRPAWLPPATIDGPYPATLEGAVRSGAAAMAVLADSQQCPASDAELTLPTMHHRGFAMQNAQRHQRHAMTTKSPDAPTIQVLERMFCAAGRAGRAPGPGVAEGDQRDAPACTLPPRTASSTT